MFSHHHGKGKELAHKNRQTVVDLHKSGNVYSNNIYLLPILGKK
jgi:hypothetical protein